MLVAGVLVVTLLVVAVAVDAVVDAAEVLDPVEAEDPQPAVASTPAASTMSATQRAACALPRSRIRSTRIRCGHGRPHSRELHHPARVTAPG
jgi:hypothetical protein